MKAPAKNVTFVKNPRNLTRFPVILGVGEASGRVGYVPRITMVSGHTGSGSIGDRVCFTGTL